MENLLDVIRFWRKFPRYLVYIKSIFFVKFPIYQNHLTDKVILSIKLFSFSVGANPPFLNLFCFQRQQKRKWTWYCCILFKFANLNNVSLISSTRFHRNLDGFVVILFIFCSVPVYLLKFSFIFCAFSLWNYFSNTLTFHFIGFWIFIPFMCEIILVGVKILI